MATPRSWPGCALVREWLATGFCITWSVCSSIISIFLFFPMKISVSQPTNYNFTPDSFPHLTQWGLSKHLHDAQLPTGLSQNSNPRPSFFWSCNYFLKPRGLSILYGIYFTLLQNHRCILICWFLSPSSV